MQSCLYWQGSCCWESLLPKLINYRPWCSAVAEFEPNWLRFSTADHSGYLPEISRKFPGKILEISRKCPGNFSEIFRNFPGSFPEISRKFPGNFPEFSRKFPGNFPDISRKFPGNVPEISRKQKTIQNISRNVFYTGLFVNLLTPW